MSSSSGFEEIAKMQAIVEMPLSNDSLYPENPDDVSDWVQRRAARRSRRPTYTPQHVDTSSSSSSRATTPSNGLHSEIFELPAGNISAAPATPDTEVDEDEIALRAAIALSLQYSDRNDSMERPFSTEQSELDEALERSRREQ
jgi:hypothetical protein